MARVSFSPVLAGALLGIGLPVVVTLGSETTVQALEEVVAHVTTPAEVPALPTVQAVAIGAALPPPPTEMATDDNAEAKQKHLRKAWFEERHGGDPDVDYKAVERINGLNQIEKRNRLALEPQPISTGMEQWVERGSLNQAGRMHVAVEAGDTLYAGSSKGGVWKRGPDDRWMPIGDNLYGGAHWLLHMAVDGKDVLLAGTDGGLLHRTNNDGVSWTVPKDLPGGMSNIRRLVKTSDGRDIVYGVFGAGAWENSRWVVRYHVLRSTDGGLSFDPIYKMETWRGDIWVPRDGGSELYMLHSGKVSRSDDDGDSWQEVGALPAASWGWGELVGSEAGAPRLWSIAGRNNKKWLLRSDDAGATWTELREATDKWTGTLQASIIDEDVFAWGGVELWRTFDAGATFTRMNKWGHYYGDPANRLHADLPGLDVVLDGEEETWYISTDGGLYESLDSLQSVQNLSLSGLRVSQYYGTLTSSADPSHVHAGAQDQGYQTTTRVLNQQDQEIRPAVEQTQSVYAFNQSISGDYAHLTSSDGTHEVVYGVYPGFIHVDWGGEDAYKFKKLDYPPEVRTHAWLPPVVADPTDANAVFFCGDKIWRYAREGNNWTPVVWSEHQFEGQKNEYISGLVFSPLDDNRAYAATNKGRLFYSFDRGKNWIQGQGVAPNPQYFYGAAIAASPDNIDLVYVGGSGYGETPGIIRSNDGGKTWNPWNQSMPQSLVYTLTITDEGRGEVFAGTETAAYRRLPDASGWVDITSDKAPVTTYWSSELVAGESTVRFGTYGRGIWDFQLDPAGTGCLDGVDADDDGVLCHLDCNDDDATIFPGAPEACDGVDNNCNPDDLPELDGDGDGFFDCEDCDDTRADVYPGAEEVRGNDIDEDCDGEAKKRCGCQSGTLSGSAWWLLLPLAGLAMRRRRWGWRG